MIVKSPVIEFTAVKLDFFFIAKKKQNNNNIK